MKKEINWKKVAMTAGVFAAGIAVGVIGGEKILNYISLNDVCKIEGYSITWKGDGILRLTTISPKTGRKLNALFSKESAEDLMLATKNFIEEAENHK